MAPPLISVPFSFFSDIMDWPIDPNASRNILINSAGLSMFNFFRDSRTLFYPRLL